MALHALGQGHDSGSNGIPEFYLCGHAAWTNQRGLDRQVITLIVPTRNRAHTLRLVASSYYELEGVSEIIVVCDAGDDDTASVIDDVSKAYPQIVTKFMRNATRLGAAGARNAGVAEASNEYILFCDDDEYLEPLYAVTCLRKLLEYDAGAVSGRNIYMLENETRQEAVTRFGYGMRRAKPFNYLIGESVNGALYRGDVSLPYTHAIILTKREYLLEEPFDPFYAKGNGYREESDFQMRLFLKGKGIYSTNEVHAIHLPPSKVRTGG